MASPACGIAVLMARAHKPRSKVKVFMLDVSRTRLGYLVRLRVELIEVCTRYSIYALQVEIEINFQLLLTICAPAPTTR
jgi:hypothetical protein